MAGEVASLHSALEPAGAHAQHIGDLWNLTMWICGVMYLLVLGFATLALLRRSRERTSEGNERRMQRALTIWATMIVIGLFALTVSSYLTDRALVHAAPEPQVAIHITAHQWWWEIEYTSADSSRRLRTANELHLPVDTDIHIALDSADVIHSFWVPSLHGKIDLIPGRPTQIELRPLTVGRYRGTCAEFCGMQHAHMALDVTVESSQQFAVWWDRQLRAPPPPTDPQRQMGLSTFVNTECALCHAISGTDAFGMTGPDLSHIASRRYLAAGALTNTPENMRAWLADSQGIKPGNRMPTVPLAPEELDALVAYLGGLQ